QVGGDDAAGAGAHQQVGVGGLEPGDLLERPGDAGVVRHADRATGAEDDPHLAIGKCVSHGGPRLPDARVRSNHRCRQSHPQLGRVGGGLVGGGDDWLGGGGGGGGGGERGGGAGRGGAAAGAASWAETR